MGTVSMIGSDDLLSCFIAGNSFTWDDWFRKETENAHMSEVVDLLLNLSMFVYIGATMVNDEKISAKCKGYVGTNQMNLP